MVGVLKFGVFVKWILCGIMVWYILLLKCCFSCLDMLFVRWLCGLYMVCKIFLIVNVGFINLESCVMVFINVVKFLRV